MKVRVALLAFTTALALGSGANAATVLPTGLVQPTLFGGGLETFNTEPAITLGNSSPIASTWSNGAATFNVGAPGTSQGLVVPYPGDSGLYAAPAGGPGGNFFSVQPAGTSSTVTFAGAGFTSLALFWGSIDTYNSIKFYNDATLLDTVTGPAPAGGNQTVLATNQYVLITLTSNFNRVVFGSTQKSFEMDNVAWGFLNDPGPTPGDVPVPLALPLFAAGLGVVGLMSRRRRKVAA